MPAFMFESTVVLRTNLFLTISTWPIRMRNAHIRIAGTAHREASCACVLLVFLMFFFLGLVSVLFFS